MIFIDPHNHKLIEVPVTLYGDNVVRLERGQNVAEMQGNAGFCRMRCRKIGVLRNRLRGGSLGRLLDHSDRTTFEALRDEEFLLGALELGGCDAEDFPDHASSYGVRLAVIVRNGGPEVFVPGFVAEGDEREIIRNAEAPLGHPAHEIEDIAGAGRDDGGRRILQAEGDLEGARHAAGLTAIDHLVNGTGTGPTFDGFREALFRGLQPSKFDVWHEKSDPVMSVALEETARVEGGRMPIFIEARDVYLRLGIAANQGGQLLIFEPELNWRRTLIENPGIDFEILDKFLEFAGGILQME